MNTQTELLQKNRKKTPLTWSAWLIPSLLCASFWPVWAWFVQRLSDRSDEPLGIVAALALLALPVLRKDAEERATDDRRRMFIVLSAFSMIAYLATYTFAPKIINAVLALACMATAVAALNLRRFYPGDWLLLGLSLPVVASLNFYLGYPMRCIVTTLSQVSLRMAGLAVHAQGTSLTYGKQLVEIDAPCSGIKMLWFAVFIAATLSALFKFNTWRTMTMLSAALVAALAGNVLRVCSLFYVETDVLNFPQIHTYEEFLHQGTGVMSFAVVAAVVGAGAYLLNQKASLGRKTTTRWATHGVAPTHVAHAHAADGHAHAGSDAPAGSDARAHVAHAHAADGHAHAGSDAPADTCADVPLTTAAEPDELWKRESKGQRYGLAVMFVLSCIAAGVFPLFSAHTAAVTNVSLKEFPGWPATFEGEALSERPLSNIEEQFLANFPGKMATFMCGNRQIIMRWIAHETRQLHPSSDCFRAQGFDVKWLPIIVQGDTRWSCYEARKGSQILNVRERIFDPTGKSWSDVSSWYWAALLGQTHGPWWSITVISA